jgi:hypothetical protein
MKETARRVIVWVAFIAWGLILARVAIDGFLYGDPLLIIAPVVLFVAPVVDVRTLRKRKREIEALKEELEDCLAYFESCWDSTKRHPASHYARYVHDIRKALGKKEVE